MEQVNTERITELMKANKLKQHEVAKKINVSQPYISTHLKDGDFRAADLLAMLEMFNVPVAELFEKTPEFRVRIEVDAKDFKNSKSASHFAHNAISALQKLGFDVHSSVERIGTNEQERLF